MQKYIDTWNDMASKNGLPMLMKLSGSRKEKLAVRCKDADFEKSWEMVLAAISSSPFLLGHNDRRWQATFDWLVSNDTNWLKVVEGRYHQQMADNQPKCDALEGPQTMLGC